MEPTPYSPAWREQQQRKARHRWGIWMIALGVLGGLGGLLGAEISGHHHSKAHHGTNWVGLSIGIVLIVVCLIFLVYMYRKVFTAKTGIWSASPLMELGWKQRRRVGKQLRHGELNDDPYVAELEYGAARKVFRHTKVTIVVFGLMTILSVWLIVEPNAPAGTHVIGIVWLAMFGLLYVPMLVMVRRGSYSHSDFVLGCS
jgi:hypothetical protein